MTARPRAMPPGARFWKKPDMMSSCTSSWERWSMSPAGVPRSFTTGGWKPSGGQVHALMRDVRAVDWLPLDQAVERLSRGYERAFLANVGPLALEAAALLQLAGRSGAGQDIPEMRRASQAATPIVEPHTGRSDTPVVPRDRRNSLSGKLREWLRRIS